MSDRCFWCEGTGRVRSAWPVGPGGAHIDDYDCSHCQGTGKITKASRPVMNPPADEAEARNRANTAPLQPDSDGQRRGVSGLTSEPEARPVTPTGHEQ